MADPCSILGAVAVAIHDIHRAKIFIERIAGAPRAVARLRDGLISISKLLDEVERFVRQPQKVDNSVFETLLQHLHAALGNCRNVTIDIETLLRP